MKSIWLTGADGHLAQKLLPVLKSLKDSTGAPYSIYATDIDECDITDEAAVE